MEVIKWVEVEKIVQVPKEIIKTVEVFVETLEEVNITKDRIS